MWGDRDRRCFAESGGARCGRPAKLFQWVEARVGWAGWCGWTHALAGGVSVERAICEDARGRPRPIPQVVVAAEVEMTVRAAYPSRRPEP